MDAKTLENGQDELSAYFDKSASTIGSVFHGIEERFITPLMQFGRRSFATWPTTSLYCTIFLALSVPPVLTFIGFSLFTVIAMVIVGLCVAFTLSVVLILVFAALLLVTLIVNLVIAAVLTLITVVFYGGSSLFMLIRAHGGQGLFIWTDQMKTQLTNGFNSIPKPSQAFNSMNSEKGEGGAGRQNAESDSSEDSAVVVKKDETDSNAEDKTAVPSPSGTASETMGKGKDLLG